ncbi:MAG: hypothetical protein J7J65_01890 [Candidatus Korarchaeota archaeon]|nr:hypothetical protein [Candidatus Korarchaeota archaeon]
MSTDVEQEIERYLNQMRIKFQKEEGVFASLWRVGDGEYWVLVFVGDEWVAIRTTILEKEQVPNSLDFYKSLLNAHYKLAEVRYDVDDDGNVGSTKTLPITGLNFDNFSSEFNSVVFAIDYFRQEIAPKFDIQV